MTGDFVFQFVYPTNADPRSVNIMRIEENTLVEFYKLFHPNTGMKIGVTSFERKNFQMGFWDNAGHVDWASDISAKVCFGTEEMPMGEVRKQKKPGISKSRRFRAGGNEYKWKIAENGKDLLCINTQLTSFGKIIAEWTQDTKTLGISERCEDILDRVVMTCYLNVHMRNAGRW